MNKQMPSIDTLIKLLDDEDDIARAAMISLIENYSCELVHILPQLQECNNERLRKRSHQLQAFLHFKQRRAHLADVLHGRLNEFYISDCLIEMHLLWYKKDSFADIVDMYRDFVQQYPSEFLPDLNNIAAFFREKQIVHFKDDTSNSHFYILGMVLDSHYGTNSLLCALAMALHQDLDSPTQLQTIRFENKFYLYEPASNLICDTKALWEVRPIDFSNYTVFTPAQLLKFIAAMTFTEAVQDDDFRYVEVAGKILAPDGSIKNLPYPYSGTK